jgi:hypothetical protein
MPLLKLNLSRKYSPFFGQSSDDTITTRPPVFVSRLDLAFME